MKGTKRERDRGVWELRAYTGRDPLTGKPRQISRTFRGGARAADTALAELVAEVAKGKHGGSNANVSALLDAWLADAERTTSPATMANYRQAVESSLRPALGHVSLRTLGVRDLDSLYDAMGKAGKSPYMIRHSHSAIRAALSTARRWGWVPTNVAELAKPPRLPEQEVTAATTWQVRKLIDTLERTDPDLAHVVLIGALTGCRRGELCGLRWSDWDGDRLHVRRRVIEAAGKVSVRDSTKTGKGKRIVMDELGIATLKRLRGLQGARAKKVGAPLPDDGYMLSLDGLGGSPRRPKAVSDAVAEAAKKAKMPEVHLHSLRHYAATELIAEGHDVRTVANRLGHADPALTLRVYSHVIEDRERDAAATLGRALAPGRPKKALPKGSENPRSAVRRKPRK